MALADIVAVGETECALALVVGDGSGNLEHVLVESTTVPSP